MKTNDSDQKVSIRRANTNDWSILQRLNLEVFEDNAIYDDDIDLNRPMSTSGEENYRQTLLDPKNLTLFACLEDKVVGYLCAVPLLIPFRKSRYLEISHMGVSLAWRSKGIGSRLIKECEKEAKLRGFQKIYVTSYWKNSLARNFYKNTGFFEESVGFEKHL